MSHDVVGVAKHWDVAALEAAARHEHDARVRARLLAMLHLAQGGTVAQTAGQYALGQSVLYGWIRRYDAEGVQGLHDRPRSGQPPHLAREHETAFLQRLHAGPPPDSGLAAWRGEDLRALLHRLGQSSLVPRPRHPQGDPHAQVAFKKRAAPTPG